MNAARASARGGKLPEKRNTAKNILSKLLLIKTYHF